MELEVSRQPFKKPQITNVMQIRPVEAEFLTVDRQRSGRTEGRKEKNDEANSLFRNFAKALKNSFAGVVV